MFIMAICKLGYGGITSSKYLLFDKNMLNDIFTDIRCIGKQMDRHDIYIMLFPPYNTAFIVVCSSLCCCFILIWYFRFAIL
jgi:hypothetical protein